MQTGSSESRTDIKNNTSGPDSKRADGYVYVYIYIYIYIYIHTYGLSISILLLVLFVLSLSLLSLLSSLSLLLSSKHSCRNCCFARFARQEFHVPCKCKCNDETKQRNHANVMTYA